MSIAKCQRQCFVRHAVPSMKNVRNSDGEILYDRMAWKVKRIFFEESSSDGKSVAWWVKGPRFKSRTRSSIIKIWIQFQHPFPTHLCIILHLYHLKAVINIISWFKAKSQDNRTEICKITSRSSKKLKHFGCEVPEWPLEALYEELSHSSPLPQTLTRCLWGWCQALSNIVSHVKARSTM